MTIFKNKIKNLRNKEIPKLKEFVILNSQISYFVKNNNIKVIGSFKKFGINMINYIKKRLVCKYC